MVVEAVLLINLLIFFICLSLPIYKDIAIGECIEVFSKSVIHPSDIIPHRRILDSYEQEILNRLCRKTKLNLSIETNSGLYMMSVRSWEMILPKSNKQSIKMKSTQTVDKNNQVFTLNSSNIRRYFLFGIDTRRRRSLSTVIMSHQDHHVPSGGPLSFVCRKMKKHWRHNNVLCRIRFRISIEETTGAAKNPSFQNINLVLADFHFSKRPQS